MNFLKVAIMLKKQLRDTAQMERHLRVRESTCFFRNLCLGKKKRLCRVRVRLMTASFSMTSLAQIRYNLTVGWLEIPAREVCNAYKG